MKPLDLQDYFRTEELYRQAVARQLVEDSESSFLNWVSAAVRAKTCGAQDPVRVFVGIVRAKLWTHISQADEDRARAAIRRYREGQEPNAAVKAVLNLAA